MKELLLAFIIAGGVTGILVCFIILKEKFIDWLNKDENEDKGDKK